MISRRQVCRYPDDVGGDVADDAATEQLVEQSGVGVDVLRQAHEVLANHRLPVVVDHPPRRPGAGGHLLIALGLLTSARSISLFTAKHTI